MKRLALSGLALFSALPAITADLPTPGSVEQSLRRPARPAPQPGEVLFRRDDGQNENDPNGRRFRVSGFELRGNTAFPDFRLKRVIERFLDRELNLYDLGRAADAISEFYQRMGYPLARALVPAQRVIDGRVRIEIVEGVLGEVRIAGNKGYGEALLLKRGGNLPKGAPISQAALEHKLLLLNDQPGLKARATLAPGKDYGSSDLLIQLEEKPFSLDAALTNAARENIGQNRLDLTLGWNNPLGLGDQFSLRGILSEHSLLKYGKLSYSLPVGNDGQRLAMSQGRVRYRVAGALSALDLGGDVKTSELAYSQPLIRSRERDRNLGLAASYKELRSSALGTTLDRKYLALATASWSERWFDDDGTAWNARAAISSNGRSNPKSTRQDAERLKTDLALDATAKLSRDWDVYARAQQVYSSQTLPDSDKFDLGGPDSVRAYRPSELRGDSGHVVTLELRHTLVVANRAAQATVFGDYGRVVYKQAGLRNGHGEIGGVGVGLTVYPSSNSALKVEYAQALTPTRADDGKRGRLWFNLSANF